MTSRPGINKTFNEILLKVFSGIDYVSKIAIETQKSIPVVYRQMDHLVKLGLLVRQRSGKTVSYNIDWMNLSDIMASVLRFDVESLRKHTNATKAERKIIDEINDLTQDLPNELFVSKNALQIAIADFMSNKEIRSLIRDFFKGLDKTADMSVRYAEMAFDESVELFFDTFGMMDNKEQKKLAKKYGLDTNGEEVLKFCRIKYLQKKLEDPRRHLLDEMMK